MYTISCSARSRVSCKPLICCWPGRRCRQVVVERVGLLTLSIKGLIASSHAPARDTQELLTSLSPLVWAKVGVVPALNAQGSDQLTMERQDLVWMKKRSELLVPSCQEKNMATLGSRSLLVPYNVTTTTRYVRSRSNFWRSSSRGSCPQVTPLHFIRDRGRVPFWHYDV